METGDETRVLLPTEQGHTLSAQQLSSSSSNPETQMLFMSRRQVDQKTNQNTHTQKKKNPHQTKTKTENQTKTKNLK